MKSAGKRLFDLAVCLSTLVIFLAPMVIVGLLVRLNSHGLALHWSRRVGVHNIAFLMPKFRTMYTNTPELASDLLRDPERFITPLGKVLRATSLDELPQLWSVVRGDMSLVGPRPALFNQTDLISLRSNLGIDRLRPGITGWAQVNGRDDNSLERKVELDFQYLQQQGFWFDLYIIWLTFLKVIRSEGVSH